MNATTAISINSSISGFNESSSNQSQQQFKYRWDDGWLNRLEFYSVPFLFALGLVGNLLGSACILANRRMRKRTPLFVLAAMGVTDSLMLVAQMQRWFSLNVFNFLDQSHTACKFYFSFLHFSLLASCSLTCILLMLRFVSLYMGTYRLSSYSNLGQALSKLSVAYTLALVSCLSSQDLFKTSKGHKEEICVKGSKEPIYVLFHLVDLIYFMLAFALHLVLLVMPILIMIKLVMRKHVKPARLSEFQDETMSLRGVSLYVKRSRTLHCNPVASSRRSLEEDKTLSNMRRRHHQSLPDLSSRRGRKKGGSGGQSGGVGFKEDMRISFSVDRLNLRFIDEVLLNDTTMATTTTATRSRSPAHRHNDNSIRLNSSLVENSKFRSKYFDVKKSERAEPKDFSMFVIVISVWCSLFSLPYLLLDYFYSNDALLLDLYGLQHDNNSVVVKTLLQLPLVLINVPYSIKFYLLFILYKKFRIQMSRFLRVRLFIDDAFLASLARRRKLSLNESRTKSWWWPPAFRFVMIHHSSSLMCCLPSPSIGHKYTLSSRRGRSQPPVCVCFNFPLGQKATVGGSRRPSLVSDGSSGVINATSSSTAAAIEADRARVSQMYNKLCREDCLFADDTSSIAGFQVYSTNPASTLNNYNTTDVSLLNLFDTSTLPNHINHNNSHNTGARLSKSIKSVPSSPVKKESSCHSSDPTTTNNEEEDQSAGVMVVEARKKFSQQSNATNTVVLTPRSPLVF